MKMLSWENWKSDHGRQESGVIYTGRIEADIVPVSGRIELNYLGT